MDGMTTQRHTFYPSYTQYILLPINNLGSWLKTPFTHVFDCLAAGMILNEFIEDINFNGLPPLELLIQVYVNN
ncbi:hypothetical protein C5167_029682 [Papaver somniferum]|nr:hypothetical protein C5167_029682 [Papaver somniferum]